MSPVALLERIAGRADVNSAIAIIRGHFRLINHVRCEASPVQGALVLLPAVAQLVACAFVAAANERFVVGSDFTFDVA